MRTFTSLVGRRVETESGLSLGSCHDLRAELADGFKGCLTAQDAAGWRAHVTIQNKVDPRVARDLLADKERGFRPRPLGLRGLALHRDRGGPWATVQRWSFRQR